MCTTAIQSLFIIQVISARGEPDSSGFEHVFIGEAKNGEISGMHSWVRFYYLEKGARNFDYKGFLVKRFVSSCQSYLIRTQEFWWFQKLMAAIKYSYGNFLKRSGSFLIGTSPEFDMALYTLCFLSRRGHFSTCNVGSPAHTAIRNYAHYYLVRSGWLPCIDH